MGDDFFTIKGQKLKQKPSREDAGEAHEDSKRPEKLKPSTRLIVKNLPKHVTEQSLREYFSQKGDVTDVKIMKTKEGKSRRFGFVGFLSLDAAKEARGYYDNTYFHTSKIQVEYAQPFGDTAIPRAWSKYSKDSSAFMDRNKPAEEPAKNNKKVKKAAEAPKDPKMKDFVETLQKGNKVWMNDDAALTQVADSLAKDAKKAAEKRKTVKKEKGKEVEMVKVPNKKPGGQGLFVTRQHVTFSEQSDDEQEAATPSVPQGEPEDAAESDDEYEDLPAAKRAKVGSAEEKSEGDEEAEQKMDVDTDAPASSASALDWLRSKAKSSSGAKKLQQLNVKPKTDAEVA